MASTDGDNVEMKTESEDDSKTNDKKRKITADGVEESPLTASQAKSSKMDSTFSPVSLKFSGGKIRVNGSKIEICTGDSNTQDTVLSFDSLDKLKRKVDLKKIIRFGLDESDLLECWFDCSQDCQSFINQLDNRQPQPNYISTNKIRFGFRNSLRIEQPNPAESELKFVFTDNLFTGKLELKCQNDKSVTIDGDEIQTKSFRVILDRDEDIPRVKKVLDDFKLNVGSSVKISRNGFEQGFSIPFTGDCIYKDLKEYIEKVTYMWDNSVTDFYAPVVKIPQSFGYGKTRLLYEFGKEHLTIFLCLRQDVNGPQNDFPLRSALADYFDTSLNQKQDDANRFFMALIMIALEEIAVLQKAPDIVKELQEPFYSDPVMRRYLNKKILMMRKAKEERNYVSVLLANDYSSIDQIITSYCQDRPNLDRKETELKVTASLKRLEELLPQMPLPVDIRLDNDLKAIDKNQVIKYANVLSIFQSWTRPDASTEYIFDSSLRVTRLKVGMRDINQAAARVESLVKKLGQPIYFALDESAYLATRQNGVEKKPFFRILSEVFRQVFQLLPVVCLSTSTSPSLAEYAFRKEKVTPSLRGAIIDRYYPPPYTQLLFMDYFVNSKYEKELDSFAQHIIEDNICKRTDGQSLYSMVLSRKPQDTLFYYGRPLWYSLKNRLNHITIARVKLISAIQWCLVDDDQKKFAAVAVLASRTTFLDNVVMPLDFSSELIAKYMATLFHINDDMTVLSYNYPSEPILAEAAAHFMSKPEILKEILREINKLISKTDITPTGELDRFVAQLVCLRARDQVGAAKAPFNMIQFSYPITVREYLTALLGEQFVNYFGEDPTKSKPDNPQYYNIEAGCVTEKLVQQRSEFLDGIVCFSHFVKKCDTLQINGVVNDFVGRCAAGLFINNFPVFDMFIPVLLKNGRFTFVLISVKNILQKSQFNETTLLSHTQIFSHLHKHNTDIRIHKDDYCLSLLFDLADESNEVTYSSSSEAFLVSGLGSFPCLNQEMIENLNQLLNASRFNRDNYNLLVQKKAFPSMYERERQYRGDTDDSTV